MTGRQFGLQWDEGEPMLEPWYGEGSTGMEGPMSLDDAQSSLIRFWQDRVDSAQSGLANAESIRTCGHCGGVIVPDRYGQGGLEHLDEDDDDHEPRP